MTAQNPDDLAKVIAAAMREPVSEVHHFAARRAFGAGYRLYQPRSDVQQVVGEVLDGAVLAHDLHEEAMESIRDAVVQSLLTSGLIRGEYPEGQTEDMQCCYLYPEPHHGPCVRIADYEIRWGDGIEDYTHSCEVHLGLMLTDADTHQVTRTNAEGTLASALWHRRTDSAVEAAE